MIQTRATKNEMSSFHSFLNRFKVSFVQLNFTTGNQKTLTSATKFYLFIVLLKCLYYQTAAIRQKCADSAETKLLISYGRNSTNSVLSKSKAQVNFFLLEIKFPSTSTWYWWKQNECEWLVGHVDAIKCEHDIQ